jgi:hypothetical protein
MNNTQIKMIRLQSGEDIISQYQYDTKSALVILNNPMNVIFKRTSEGTVMIMMPWLPIEIIKENEATIASSDILTVYDPNDDLVEYYTNIVIEAEKRLIQNDTTFKNITNSFGDYDYDDDEEDDIEEEVLDDDIDKLTKEEVLEIVNKKKLNRLH